MWETLKGCALKGLGSLSLSSSVPAGWNAEEMAGAGAAISAHEMEVIQDRYSWLLKSIGLKRARFKSQLCHSFLLFTKHLVHSEYSIGIGDTAVNKANCTLGAPGQVIKSALPHLLNGGNKVTTSQACL